MKRILYAALVAVLTLGIASSPVKAKAQAPYTHSLTKTISAADTITYTSIEGSVVMFEYNYTESSGTTAGKIYLEGKFLNSWVKLDSVSLTDVATVQTLRVTVTQTSYKSYRWVNTNTSTATGSVLAGYLRRPGARVPAPAPIPDPDPLPLVFAKHKELRWAGWHTVMINKRGNVYRVRKFISIG